MRCDSIGELHAPSQQTMNPHVYASSDCIETGPEAERKYGASEKVLSGKHRATSASAIHNTRRMHSGPPSLVSGAEAEPEYRTSRKRRSDRFTLTRQAA